METLESLIQELNDLLPMSEENRRRLDQKIRLEFNYNSNHMEGNTLTYGETKLLLLFDKTSGKHDLRELEEMKAHDIAFEIIKQWADEPDRPLTEAALRELHEVLLVRPFWKEAETQDGQTTRREIQIGAYKAFPNSVRLQNGDMFHYASPEETPIQMGELIAWYREEEEKKELHPIQLAAILHYRFVRIHPFDDGNGRMARLLMNYVLMKHHLPPVIIKSSGKREYLFSLNQADAGNVDAFINYIENQVKWSLELYIKAAKGENIDDADDLQKQINIWKKNLLSGLSNDYKRNDGVVRKAYLEGGLKELFEMFVRDHQIFQDLFVTVKTVVFWGNKTAHSSSIDQLTEVISAITPEYYLNGYFNRIGMQIQFDGFKKNESSGYTFASTLEVKFHSTYYDILYNDGKLHEVNYGDNLTEDERLKIGARVINRMFNDLKSGTDRIK